MEYSKVIVDHAAAMGGTQTTTYHDVMMCVVEGSVLKIVQVMVNDEKTIYPNTIYPLTAVLRCIMVPV